VNPFNSTCYDWKGDIIPCDFKRQYAEILLYQTATCFQISPPGTIGRRPLLIIIQKWLGLYTSNPVPLVMKMSKIKRAIFCQSVNLWNNLVGCLYGPVLFSVLKPVVTPTKLQNLRVLKTYDTQFFNVLVFPMSLNSWH
jgi:hypothetical protein